MPLDEVHGFAFEATLLRVGHGDNRWRPPATTTAGCKLLAKQQRTHGGVNLSSAGREANGKVFRVWGLEIGCHWSLWRLWRGTDPVK
jgi:hypothetical protein